MILERKMWRSNKSPEDSIQPMGSKWYIQKRTDNPIEHVIAKVWITHLASRLWIETRILRISSEKLETPRTDARKKFAQEAIRKEVTAIHMSSEAGPPRVRVFWRRAVQVFCVESCQRLEQSLLTLMRKWKFVVLEPWQTWAKICRSHKNNCISGK